MSDMGTDALELIITSRIEGAEETNAAAMAANRYAVAENRAANAVRSSLGPHAELARNQRDLADARKSGGSGSEIVKGGAPVGPYEIARRRQAELSQAQERGTVSPDRLKDLGYLAKRAQARVETIENADQPHSIGKGVAQALMSSRFQLPGAAGGLQPLVGQAIKAVGGPGAQAALTRGLMGVIASPLGLAAAAFVGLGVAAYHVADEMRKAAVESAQNTALFSSLRAQVGGTSLDAAQARMMSRVTGVDAGSAAGAFQQRITSDPLAMAMAAQMGVTNLKGPFGRQDHGAQYTEIVKKVSAIQNDDQRLRVGRTLGVSAEAEKYRQLSPDAQAAMDQDAGVTARINNPEQEKRAAAVMAAMQRVDQAKENLATAWGSMFEGDTATVLNWWADLLENVADGVNTANAFMESLGVGSPDSKKLKNAVDKVRAQQTSGGAAGGQTATGGMYPGQQAGGDFGSALSDNVSATNANTAALSRLSGIVGGGERARSAIPSGLSYGPNLHRALGQNALRLGAL